MSELRGYQLDAVAALITALRIESKALCVMATGLGKTEVMLALTKQAKRPVVMLMGRDKLIAQTARRALYGNIDAAVYSAGQGTRDIGHVTVASIHSADGLCIPDAGLIIIDEVHNVDPAEGRYRRFLDRHPEARLAGFTATPWRMSVPIYGHDTALFDRVCYRRGLLEGIADGYLVPPVARAMPLAWDASSVGITAGDYNQGELGALVRDAGKIAAQVDDALARLSNRKAAVWICTSIEHAESVAEELVQRMETVAVMHSKAETEGLLKSFEGGVFRHVVSVMMLTEGIDVPCIDAIVLMRPTRSPTLAVQAIGRGLRPSPGKADCLVLDYGEVIQSIGPLHDPYLRQPGERRAAVPLTKAMRVCPGCLAYLTPEVRECPDCGHESEREVDRLKRLKREASDADPLGGREPEVLACSWVELGRHRARSGNDCLVLAFTVAGRMWPVKAFGSEHVYSWMKFQAILNELTPFRFTSWKECYDAVPLLAGTLVTPKTVTVKRTGDFENVVAVTVE